MNMLGRKVSLFGGLLAVAAFLLAASVQAPARAAQSVASLDVVPADAAFYSALLRNREQYDAIVNSKAFAKIMELPYVKQGLQALEAQTGAPGSPLGMLADPEVKKSLAFLADIFSDEVFVYGDADFNQTIELVQGVSGAVQYNPALAGQTANGAQMEEIQGRMLVQALLKHLDLIKLPDLVIGCKVKDQAAAKEQLDKLEAILQQFQAQLPPTFKDCLKKATIDGHSYLTITLDGSMVPWDPGVVEKIRSLAPTPSDGDKLIEQLKKTTLTISLGLRDDYLLLAIGPSTDELARLGKGATLRSRPELAAVAKFADKRICSVGYLSKAISQHFNQTKSEIDNLLVTVKGLLPSLHVPDKMRDDITKDASGLAEDIKKYIPEAGAASSLGFLTASGMENYDYDWSEHPDLDSSKPLDLLKHVGGTPIAVFVGRTKVSPEGYELLVKWIGVGYRYFEEYGLPQMNPQQRARFDKISAQVKPLVARVDKATHDLLIPALADGQSGFVLDAQLTSTQFIKALPATEKPMPMLEPAIVMGVSNADMLRKAFTEYYAVADDLVEVLKGIEESAIPKDFKLQHPRVYNLSVGTAYGYPLPAEWGVDTHIQPNAGLSEKVAVLSLSGKHTLRLLQESSPKIAGLALPTNRPLAAAGGLDFVALVNAATPWVEYGIDQAKLPPQDAEMARQHAKVVLQVLKAYRGTLAVVYVEGKVTVTHSRSEFHDID